MTTEITEGPIPTESWSWIHKAGFRLLLVWVLAMSDWGPFIPFIGRYLVEGKQAVTIWLGDLLQLPTSQGWNGSGDRSIDYVYLIVSGGLTLLVGIIWTIVDNKRPSYTALRRWFRAYVRYYLSIVLLTYGFSKIFLFQMPPPSLTELAAPMGNNSMMGIAWNFIGASSAYEIFSGTLEVVAGLLLLFRRTTFIGALIAAGVLFNVAVMNFCYDIPVKLYSSFLTLLAVYLLSHDALPLWRYIVKRKAITEPTVEPRHPGWRLGIKALIILFFIYTAGISRSMEMEEYREARNKPPHRLYGNYDVIDFSVNGVPFNSTADQNRWTQVVIGESFDSTSHIALIRKGFQEYKRGWVRLLSDSMLVFDGDPTLPTTLSFHYTIPDSSTVILDGSSPGLTIKATLRRSTVVYRYNEYKFRWIIG